jgi:hypothetical protein
MQRQGAIEFARVLGLGAPSRTSNAVWLHYRCPFAQWKHDDKRSKSHHFNISVSEDRHSIYQCWSCHSKGSLPQLAYELGRLRKQDLTHIGKQIELQELLGPQVVLPKWDDEIPEEYSAQTTPDQIEYPDPRREFEFPSATGIPYLRDRSISVSTIIRLGIRYDPYQRRVLFPVYDTGGRFAGFTGRRIDAAPLVNADGDECELDGRPYLKVRDYFGFRKRQFFLGELGAFVRTQSSVRGYQRQFRTGSNTRIALVEGIFDHAFLSELGIPSIAILGTAVTPEKIRKLIRWDRPVVLFMDNDSAGHDCIETIKAALFGKIPLLSVQYPEGYELADPGSLPPGVIHSMMKDAELITRI